MWQARVYVDPITGARQLYVFRRMMDNTYEFFRLSVEMIEKLDHRLTPPTFSESREEIEDNLNVLQLIFDACWDSGMRPRGFADVAGELGATRQARDSMEKIAIGLLEKIK